MLPSNGRGRGRGRARNRNSGQESRPGTPQSPVAASRDVTVGERSSFQLLERKVFVEGPHSTTESPALGSGESQVDPKKRLLDPEELGIQFKRKVSISTNLPLRPDNGSVGKRIKLISNCFPVKVPSGNVYHYDVNIIRKRKDLEAEQYNTGVLPAGFDRDEKKYRCLSTKTNREVVAFMLRTRQLFDNSFAAFDGQKNLYTRNPLHGDFPMRCEVVIPNENGTPETPRQDTYVVQVKPVIKKDSGSCAINLDMLHAFFDKKTSSVPQECVMALETILRHGPCLRYIPIGRSFFYPPGPNTVHPLGGGLEIWFGYHQSIRLGQWGPMVNFDVTATTFFEKGPLLKYVGQCLHTTEIELRRRPYLPSTEIKRVSNKLKNLSIEVTHLRNYRRKYRIMKLTKESANRLEFDMTVDGKTVKKTVANYFRERYDRTLQYPNLPCVRAYPESKNIYLPMEVCEILQGQHSKQKLEARQKADMIKYTAISPSERFVKIRHIAKSECEDNHIREFNLEVSPQPLSLEGRILDPPNIRYKDNDAVKPRDGYWNMKRSKFLVAATIKSWVLLNFSNLDSNTLSRFSEMLVKTGKETGMTINCPRYTTNVDTSRADMKTLLHSMKQRYEANLALIILPTNDKFTYGKVKQVAETGIGLVTQCVREINVSDPRKCNASLMVNLCQKINVKMGGENNSLLFNETPDVLKKPVIVIGADVNHPGPARGVKPSLAACIGSLNAKMTRFAVSIRAQTNVDEQKQAVEIIKELKVMILELLKAFYRHTAGKKPEKIIFYRDGVSEGQFQKVRDYEVACLRDACRTLEPDYEPGITFIVVQKRHHTRFMPQDDRDGAGNMRNVPPGTIVDTSVTHPLNFDFFLCSHMGLKGTSRPSHYTVMEDDNGFKSDDLQKLTYQLCHTYARCTRSISIPVPVAYADIAAYRARQHLEAALEESTASSDSSGGSGNSGFHPLSETVTDAIKVIAGLQTTMYFV